MSRRDIRASHVGRGCCADVASRHPRIVFVQAEAAARGSGERRGPRTGQKPRLSQAAGGMKRPAAHSGKARKHEAFLIYVAFRVRVYFALSCLFGGFEDSVTYPHTPTHPLIHIMSHNVTYGSLSRDARGWIHVEPGAV